MGAIKPPGGRPGQSRQSRTRWALVMSTAVIAAVVITHQPSGSGRARVLAEQEGDSWVSVFEQHGASATTTSQQQLTGRAACIAEAVDGPPPVHGWVDKAGPLDMDLLDGPHTTERHRAYFAWRDSGNTSLTKQDIKVDGKTVQVGHAPPLFPYCRILVNHVYRTMYLKAPKTGSTSLLTLLGTCSGVTDKSTCFEPLQVTSLEEYKQLYSDYFVFTVIRNPWTRAVSSYRMLSRYMRNTCRDLVGGWNNVCLDLNHLGRLHHDNPECTMHKQQGEGFAMHHLIPQAPCLVTPTGEWAADYVVRTENMEEDMREVLKEMDSRRQPDAEPLDIEAILSQLTNVNKVNVACHGGLTTDISAIKRRQTLAQTPMHLEAPESYCDMAQYYVGQHSQCFDALRAYYADDMRLFGMPHCLDA